MRVTQVIARSIYEIEKKSMIATNSTPYAITNNSHHNYPSSLTSISIQSWKFARAMGHVSVVQFAAVSDATLWTTQASQPGQARPCWGPGGPARRAGERPGSASWPTNPENIYATNKRRPHWMVIRSEIDLTHGLTRAKSATFQLCARSICFTAEC